jgi:hypothetical protein
MHTSPWDCNAKRKNESGFFSSRLSKFDCTEYHIDADLEGLRLRCLPEAAINDSAEGEATDLLFVCLDSDPARSGGINGHRTAEFSESYAPHNPPADGGKQSGHPPRTSTPISDQRLRASDPEKLRLVDRYILHSVQETD